MKRLYCLYLFLAFTATAAAQRWMTDEEVVINEAGSGTELIETLPKSGIINAYIADGQQHYNAAVKNHRFHGSWSSWYANGKACDAGKLINGLPDGEWKVWYSNGQLKYIRTYHADKWHRIKEDLQRNHPRFKSYAITSLYSRNTQLARFYLTASYSFNNTSANAATNWLQRVTSNTSSNNYMPVFNKCLQHGLYMNFTEDGLVTDSGYYVNGLRHGVWMHTNANNITIKGFYNNGKKTGEWKEFNSKGRLQKLCFYNKQGVLTGSKQINKTASTQ